MAVFADDIRHGLVEELLSGGVDDRFDDYAFYTSYDDFISRLPSSGCDAIIVAHRGATGMLAVRAARILLRHVPLVWLSDDSAFLEESFKSGCAYFSAEPITENMMKLALQRCGT